MDTIDTETFVKVFDRLGEYNRAEDALHLIAATLKHESMTDETRLSTVRGILSDVDSYWDIGLEVD